MREILLTFTTLSVQKGAAAQVISLVSQIRKIRNDLRITLISHYADLDAHPAAMLGIDVTGYPLFPGTTANSRNLELMFIRLGLTGWALARRAGCTIPLVSPKVISSAYRRADLVLDLSGDSYRDPPGGKSIAHNVNLLTCHALGVPCAIMSQSLGPFRWHSRSLTRYCLNRAKLIYVREMRTWRMLTEMGVNSSLLHFAPDLAFALPPSDSQDIDRILATEFPDSVTLPRPWVGISTSSLLFTRFPRSVRELIIRKLSELVLHINHTLNASVFLIPHEIKPAQLGPDDVCAANLLAKKVGRPLWLHIIRGNYGPCDLKGVISRFDAFVACRMHAGIAALSSGVPTVMVSWSHKYEGLMEELGLPQFVWNIRAPAQRDLVRMFDDLWQEREAFAERLRSFNTGAEAAIETVVARAMNLI